MTQTFRSERFVKSFSFLQVRILPQELVRCLGSCGVRMGANEMREQQRMNVLGLRKPLHLGQGRIQGRVPSPPIHPNYRRFHVRPDACRSQRLNLNV